jgi:UDP-N-acetylmuramyl pentapeptide synthase
MTEKLFFWGELEDACKGRWIRPPKAGTGITAISTDSRTIKPGDLYLALAGDRFDGHDFVPAALENGAAALVVSQSVDANIPTLLVPDTLATYLPSFVRARRLLQKKL